MPKIVFDADCTRTPEVLAACVAYTKSMNFPRLLPAKEPNHTPLAIVGGGPSINEHLEELKDWPGDIWAINHAYGWCKDHGMKPVYFAIDTDTYIHGPHPTFEAIGKGDPVIVPDRISTECIDWCLKVGANVHAFDEEMAYAHVTTATWGLKLSACLGRSDVTFFGCESSYREGQSSHAYKDFVVRDRIVVDVAGEEYLTKPELLQQALWLAFMIKRIPSVYKERSGGLLRALIASDGEYDITKVPRWMMDMLTLVDDGTAARVG